MIFTCYKENFKSVKTLVVFFLCLLGDLIDLVPCITKSLSSTELTDNVTSNEKKKKDIQLYEWTEYLKLTQHIIIYMVWKSYECHTTSKIYNGYINVVK